MKFTKEELETIAKHLELRRNVITSRKRRSLSKVNKDMINRDLDLIDSILMKLYGLK